MNDGRPSRIFNNIFCGILPCNIDPAGVKLGLEKVGGNCAVKNINGIFIAEFDKLEIVIVIKKLNTELFCGKRYFADYLNC